MNKPFLEQQGLRPKLKLCIFEASSSSSAKRIPYYSKLRVSTNQEFLERKAFNLITLNQVQITIFPKIKVMH